MLQLLDGRRQNKTPIVYFVKGKVFKAYTINYCIQLLLTFRARVLQTHCRGSNESFLKGGYNGNRSQSMDVIRFVMQRGGNYLRGGFS